MNLTSLEYDIVWSNFGINVSANNSIDRSTNLDIIDAAAVISSSSITLHHKNESIPVTWNSSADCHVVSYYFHVGVGVLVSIVAAIAVIGNFLVLCTYSRYSSLWTSSNFLVMNLTIADFIMSCLDFPMFAVSSFNGCWLLGYAGCQIYGSTTSVFSLVTINTLAVISFDRYFVVVHRLSPMHKMAKSTTGFIITTIWILSIVWSVLPITGFGSYRLEGVGTSCTFNYIDQNHSQRLFFICLVTFNFIVPLLVIVYSYCGIFAYVKRVKRELKFLQRDRSSTGRQRIDTAAEIKTAITAIVIISIFCTAWTPYVIIAFVGLFGPEGSITPLISVFPNILAKVSTVSNPILYTLGHRDLRRKLKALLFSNHQKSSTRSTYATAAITTRDYSTTQNNPIRLYTMKNSC